MPLFFATILIYAFPLITNTYALSFCFDKAESAYKYVLLLLMAEYGLAMLMISTVLKNSKGAIDVLEVFIPPLNFSNNISEIITAT
jgi:hypothetical protein